MLTLHLGMPKTATSTLQTLLAVQGDALAEHNILYPVQWRDKVGKAHHDLARTIMFGTPEDVQYLATSVAAYAAQHCDSDIILSSEILANSLNVRRVDALLQLIDAVSVHMPVRMVLAMRRMDEFLESMYLHGTKHGNIDVSIEDFVESRRGWISNTFDMLGKLQATHDILILPYRKDGGFLKSLISAVGIPEAAHLLLDKEKVMNTKLGIKAQTVLFNLDHVGRSIGKGLHRLDLFRDLEAEKIAFSGDKVSYRVMPYELAKSCHEYALDLATRHGVAAYRDTYKDAILKPYRHDSLSLDNIAADDKGLLSSWADRNWEERVRLGRAPAKLVPSVQA